MPLQEHCALPAKCATAASGEQGCSHRSHCRSCHRSRTRKLCFQESLCGQGSSCSDLRRIVAEGDVWGMEGISTLQKSGSLQADASGGMGDHSGFDLQ
jgi:hypothetical protein